MIQDLVILDQQAPQWIWLAIASLMVIAALVLGRSLFMAPAVSAVAISGLGFLGLHMLFWMELALFASLAVTLRLAWFSLSTMPNKRTQEALAVLANPKRYIPESVAQARAFLLVGRIGRTTTDFINATGRIEVDGKGWDADLTGIGSEDRLPPDRLVRIVGVSSGARLKVRGLHH